MLIESGTRHHPPDEPPPDRWSEGSLRPLLPWAHVLVVSTASFAVPGWGGIVLSLLSLVLALEVANRLVREHRARPDHPT